MKDKSKTDGEVTIVAVGDVNFAKEWRWIKRRSFKVPTCNVKFEVSLSSGGYTPGEVFLQKTSRTPSFYFQNVKEIVQNADVSLCNLEQPFSDRAISPRQKDFTFLSPVRYLRFVKEAGFDILSVANNHILDYGEIGLKDTLYYINKYKMLPVGAGFNTSQAHKPIIISVNSQKLGFLAYTKVFDSEIQADSDKPGCATYPDNIRGKGSNGLSDNPLKEIQELKAKVDIAIISLHFGVEYSNTVNSEQEHLARRVIDSGASVVIGHHPHVVQKIERYKEGIIFYSLGNFIFGCKFKEKEAQYSIISLLNIRDGGISEAYVYPIRNIYNRSRSKDIMPFQPTVATGKYAHKIFEHLLKIGSSAIKFDEEESKITVV